MYYMNTIRESLFNAFAIINFINTIGYVWNHVRH